jgi:tRNA pseudouridine13 synthase
MKLKSRPEDFIVTEISSFTPDPSGRLFVYELTKRSLATLEALSIIARHAGLPARDLSAAGLKDKHGLTRQLFSSPRVIKAGPIDERLELRLVGKTRDKLTAGSIIGNAFEITLRNLKARDLEALPRNLDEIARCGIPNYYDNQRFGGIAHGQGFIAKALVLGNFEEALRLHLAVPHRKQNLTDKQNRRLARDHWGNWPLLHQKLRRSPERALVEYLVENPSDFAGCFERITASLRNLFVAAYQSYLFNETLRRCIAASGVATHTARNRGGELLFHREPIDLPHELPLPGPNTDLASCPELAATLESEGITLEGLQLKGLSRTGFKAAMRDSLLRPRDLEVGPVQPDEMNAGASKLEVKFSLGRGCFATIVTRRMLVD